MDAQRESGSMGPYLLVPLCRVTSRSGGCVVVTGDRLKINVYPPYPRGRPSTPVRTQNGSPLRQFLINVTSDSGPSFEKHQEIWLRKSATYFGGASEGRNRPDLRCFGPCTASHVARRAASSMISSLRSALRIFVVVDKTESSFIAEPMIPLVYNWFIHFLEKYQAPFKPPPYISFRNIGVRQQRPARQLSERRSRLMEAL